MPARKPRTDPVLNEYALARLDSLLGSEDGPQSQPKATNRARVPDGPQSQPAGAANRARVPHGRNAASDTKTRVIAWVGQAPRFLRAHMAVVAAVLVLGGVVTAYVLTQTGTSSVAVQVTPTVQESTDGPSPSVTAASAAAMVQVHIIGAVARPGVISVPVGSRVADAIAAAGGLRPDADPAELNMAMAVPDGSQIVIGTKKSPRGALNTGQGAVGSAAGSSGGGSAGSAGASVNLNTATQAQLVALPGVGPVTASKIIEWRSSHGRFNRIEELQEVSGIGEKTFAQIAPHVHV